MQDQEIGDLFGRAGAQMLPTPVSPAWYEPTERAWYGQNDYDKLGARGRKSKNLVPCCMTVSYAPTGRAKCRRCGEAVEKESLRLGYPFRWRQNEDAYSLYLHPECYVPEVFGIKEKELRSKVFGFQALNNTERTQLWRRMRSTRMEKGASKESQAAANDLANSGVGPSVDVAKLPAVKVPKEITVKMLPYQKEGLTWMCHQEGPDSAVKGGILADEMGMGKTLQAISLLVSQRQKNPCLVVSPMAAVMQWVAEIERFTAEGTLRVMVYHGVDKARTAAEFRKSDVVVTTYQTLENSYRREMDKLRVTCKWCGKLFQPEKLKIHQRYFCGPHAQRTHKQKLTERKHQDAAKKAMVNMGIAGKDAAYSPPTITNIFRGYMKEAGVDIKSTGYWNVRREVAERMQAKTGASASSSSVATSSTVHCAKCEAAAKGETVSGLRHSVGCGMRQEEPTQKGEALNRERLALLDAAELRALCQKRGLATGRKPDMIDRLMDVAVRGKSAGGGTIGKQLVARAKAQAKFAKAQQRGQATAKGKKGAAVAQAPRGCGSSARTVASQKAAAAASKGAKGAAGKQPRGKGTKRTAAEMEDGCSTATYEGPPKDLSGSPLHCVTWSRVILDEAHRIKGRVNSTALAAYELKSQAKWCLTGTPLQNRVGELYSLIRFLRMRPFAFYYCKKKGCTCECSCFVRDRYCPNCGHVCFMHYSAFKKQVSNPIIKFGYMGAGKQAFQTLRNDVLAKVMLRRTKEERKADLHLPPIKVMIRKDSLSQQEKDFYESLYMQSRVRFDTYVESGTILHNYAHIFDLLTSLRRAVDHPYLIVHGGGASTHQLKDGTPRPQATLHDICGLCQDEIADDEEEVKRVSHCGHAFHLDCIKAYMADAPALPSGGVGCPVCFTKLNIQLDDPEEEGDDEEASDGKTGSGRARRAAKAAPAAQPPAAKAPRRGPSSSSAIVPASAAATPPPAQRGGGLAPGWTAKVHKAASKDWKSYHGPNGETAYTAKKMWEMAAPPAAASQRNGGRGGGASSSSLSSVAAPLALGGLETPEKQANPEQARRRLAGKGPVASPAGGENSLAVALAQKTAAAAPAAATSSARPDHRSCALAAGMGKKSILQKIRASEFQSSTKIEALVDEVNKMMAGDPANKAIVFSQFGAMLELVEFRLKRAGMACVVLRGGMSMQARVDAITAFNSDRNLRVILISLKAGGEGLNLQVANHVFLLDPWWNPACELQAIQRAHRIGQTREVRAVRFITSGTVEEKIIALQEKKQLVFDGAIDNSAAAITKLTEQDLRFLFQH